jgi:xylulokinase
MASGGSGLRWFQRELAAGAPLGVLDEEAGETPPGADGIVMLPYLLGEKTPVHDPLARGAFAGLSLGHGRGHVFRALLEGFAYGVRHHLDVLAEHGVLAERARVTNGGASSALWKQIVADVSGLILEPVVDHPGSALGAAFAAGMGCGAFTDWSEIGRFVAVAEPVVPRHAVAAVYDDRYRAYRTLAGAVRPAT